MTSIRAGAAAWTQYDNDLSGRTLDDLYALRWALYSGDLFADLNRWSPLMRDRRIYANTKLLYKHSGAAVDFYAMTVYQGDLSTDGRQLADGTKGAIPIDPQVPTEADERALWTAFGELVNGWNLKQSMSTQPMIAAALGDCPTELFDDIQRGFVYPIPIWPGFVKDIALDAVDNVKAYTLEYQVTETDAKGKATETYTFTKKVDKEAFRYFKNDRPFAYPAIGDAVQPNPYGFVPMTWDRHKINPFDVRGIAATDSTQQALLDLNSFLSHGRDFQQKAFAAPVVIRSASSMKPSSPSIDTSLPTGGSADENARALAETTNWWQGDKDAGIAQATFDVGDTMAMIEFVRDGILAENPEASFFRELREMSQVTAPGAERLLGDAAARCRRARANHDTQTTKRIQMAISMMGMRAHQRNTPGWSGTLTKRQQAFAAYDLDSYQRGVLDFGISDRPVILPTEAERIDLIDQTSRLGSWALGQLGKDDAEIKQILTDQQRDALVIGDYGSADNLDQFDPSAEAQQGAA